MQQSNEASNDLPIPVNARRCLERYPGTTIKQWYKLLPEFEARGIAVRRGKAWWTRWSAIDAALLSAPSAKVASRKR